jgi:hypothetical protein
VASGHTLESFPRPPLHPLSHFRLWLVSTTKSPPPKALKYLHLSPASTLYLPTTTPPQSILLPRPRTHYTTHPLTIPRCYLPPSHPHLLSSVLVSSKRPFASVPFSLFPLSLDALPHCRRLSWEPSHFQPYLDLDCALTACTIHVYPLDRGGPPC